MLSEVNKTLWPVSAIRNAHCDAPQECIDSSRRDISARTASGPAAFDDINLEKQGAYKDCATPFCSAYTQSKLANVLFAKELARRVPAGLEVRAAAAVYQPHHPQQEQQEQQK